jgi:hypothetical protein
MNSQDLHNLQEAYMDVYGLDEKFSDDTKRRATRHIKDTKKLLRSMGTEIDDKYNPEPEGYEPKSDKKIKKKTQKEQVDLYDIILSHLLDEGYAETQEQAEVIMVNMSEDWRESIVEELTGTRRKRAIKLGYKELATGKEGSRTTKNRDSNLPTKRSGSGTRINPEWSNPGQSLGAAKVDVTGEKESDRGSGNKAARRSGKKVKDNEDRHYWNDDDPDF